MPNPAYLGETDGGTGGLSGTASGPNSDGQPVGTDESGTGGTATASGGGDTTGASASGPSGEDTSGGEAGTTMSEDDTTGSDAAPACPRADGLRVCVQFDVDQPDQVVDESANGYGVSIEGGTLVASPWGRGLRLDAETRVEVDCEGQGGGGPTITYEAWVRVEAAPQDRSGVIDNNGILGLFITPELGVRCVSQDGTAEGGMLSLDTWAHVACVADDGLLVTYLDGTPVAERTGDPLVPIDMDDPLALGNDMPSFADPLFGELDRVRVWDVALTPAQIQDAATP